MDEHGPQSGCNYRHCGIPEDAVNCPFTADAEPEAPAFATTSTSIVRSSCPRAGDHEWRQVVGYMPARFFCIHCLTITTPSES